MNSKIKKAIASVCMVASVLTLVPAVSMAETADIPVNNQQETSISPYMLYIRDARSDLKISGTTATVDCTVKGEIGTATKAKVIAELQLKSDSDWLPVKIWTATNESYEAYVNESYSVKSGNTYRVKATVTVWEGSQSETQYVYSAEKSV